MKNHDHDTIHGLFNADEGGRGERLTQSEKHAYWTIPSVFPPVSNGDNNNVAFGMLDSLGAAVANHMSNKVVTTMFSPNRPFFRMIPNGSDPKVKELYDAAEGNDPQNKQAAHGALESLRGQFSRTEKDAVKYLERIGYRTAATTAAKLLIITGDCIIKSTKDEKSVVYSMRDYVCKKDLQGNDVYVVLRDQVSFGQLDEETQKTVREARALSQDNQTELTAGLGVTLYTMYDLQSDGRFVRMQAVDNVDLPSTKSEPMLLNDTGIVHLSWNLTKGEDYGRGLVEDFGGSFHLVDSLTNAAAQLAAKLADIKILVDPQSGVDIDALNTSDTGTYISGKPSDVQMMASGIDSGMQYIAAMIDTHKRQISAAFLYQTGQTRDAERVTAEEIQNNAAELELSHGGVYSRFSTDWQARVARDAVRAVGEEMGDVVEPQILTGMDSLSRTGEMQSIHLWTRDLAAFNDIPEEARAVIKMPEYANYAAVQRGVDHAAFVMSPAEFAEAQAKAQQQEQQRIAAEQQGKLAAEQERAVAAQ